MKIIFGKITRIIVGVISLLIEVSNLFLGNIIIYEATEGITFDWLQLLKSPMFWVIIIVNVIYQTLPLIIKQRENKTDNEIEKAISKSSVKLIGIVVESAKKGNFEVANKTLEIFDKVQERIDKDGQI